MATDIIALTGHQLTLSEIVHLPDTIDQWTEIRELFAADAKGKSDFGFSQETLTKQSQLKCYWDIPVDEHVIQEFWQSNEGTDADSLMFLACYLHTWFGWLKIHRHTIQIVLLPEHKYVNLLNADSCRYVLSINRAIAARLGQELVVYGADNGYSSYIIEEMALTGSTLDEIVAHGNVHFGTTNPDLRAKICTMYFIDRINDRLEPFETIHVLELREI